MLGRIIVIITIITLLVIPAAAPARAQPAESCTVIFYGSGRGPVTVNVPSWATRLRAYVEWSGLQLRFVVDGTVHGSVMYDEPWVQTGYNVQGWGGARVIRWGGISINYVGAWTLYACGSPPPTPTPTLPTPTPTPMIATGPGCESRVGEPAEWITGSLTIYGPAYGWYVISVYEDPGASGASGVRWRLTRSGGYITPPPEDRRGNSSFDVGVGESATITVIGADGPGVPGLWIAVSAVCRGLEATPVAPGEDDLQPVEFGVVDEGQECPIELPRVVFTFSPPFLPSFSFDFQGVRICFVIKRLLLGWGSFNVMDWAIPLLSLGFVWTAWLSLRRG
jgi:hypothetical protein